ncbi:immunoglobulin Z heavy chain constant [Labeo rohita]|nr:immunoglobulin Z heavy chain constant [Labeo rohita]
METLIFKTLELKIGLQILVDLPEAVVTAIKTRFAEVLESEDAVLAAVTLPKFKLCWLRTQDRKDKAKASLLAECRKLVLDQDQQAAQPSAPKSIFPMSQCTSDSEFLTIGCLARGFSPADSVTFKWKNHADKELSDFVQYPAFGREGDYAKISHMRVRKSEWDAQKPYKCEASNSKGTVYSRVAPAPKRVNKPTIALLSRKDGDRTVLECQLNDYFPDKLTVQWLEGDRSASGQIDKKFQNTDKGEKTYTYISQLPISAPYEDKKYTCKATFNSEEFKKEYKTCEAPDNTKVSWLTDNVSKTTTKEAKDPSNNIVSTLTLSKNEWLTLKTVVCIAKHPCVPEVRNEIPAGYIKKDPVVVIRRTLMKSAQADSAVLECVVNDLPSGDATIELSVISSVGQSSSDSQKLLCSVTGFDPKIKWLSQFREKTGRDPDITVMEDGRVKAYSEILVPRQEWNQGVTYTCQATSRHSGKKVEKSTSVCTAPSLFKPSVQIKRDIQQSTVTISCVVEAPDNTKVSWLTDNVSKTTTKEAKDPSNNIVSTLTLSKNEWLTLKTVVCIAKHPCVPEVRKEIPAGYIKKDPVVVIRRTLMKSAQADSAVLECVVNDLPSADATIELSVVPSVGQSSSDSQKLLCSVTGFDPKIKWLSQSREKPGSASDVTVMEDGRVKVYSEILVPQQEWTQGVTYTCQATSKHSGKTVEKHTSVCTDNVRKPATNEVKDPSNNIVSTLTLPRNEWLTLKTVVCIAKHPCFPEERVEIPAGYIKKDPVVVVRRTLMKSAQADSAVLECVVNDLPSGDATIELSVISSVGQSSSDSQKLLCSVTGFDPKIKWLSQSREKPGRASDITVMEDGRVKVYSEILVPRQEWNQGVTYTCQATSKHSGKTVEKSTSVCTGYIKKDPVVVIRRTLMKSAQADSAVLECVVNDLPSGDATIELSVISSVGQSSSDSQKLLCSVTGFDPKIKWLSQSREKPGSASNVTVMEDGRVKVYSEILVPQQEWTQGVTYICQADSRHSGKTVEKSTSVCTAPDNTKVSWLTDNVSKPATKGDKDPSNNIVSTLTLSKDEWLTLKTVVCIAKHPCFSEDRGEIPAGYIKKDPAVMIRRTLMKSAQADSAVLECVVNGLPSAKFALTLKPPIQREIFLNNKVVLEAVVSGETVEKASVSCSMNGIDVGQGNIESSNDISQSIKKFKVTVDTNKWFDGKEVSCTTSDINNKDIKQTIRFNNGDGKKPNVTIYKPDSIGTGPVSHVCEVTSPKLGDVYIMWKVDELPYREGTTSASIVKNGSMSVFSILTMTKKEYEDPKISITCAVIYANMKNARSPLQVSTGKNESPESGNCFALDCNKDVLEEDEFRSLWSTATSFIFLFLFSLTYSIVLHFCKVKH